MQTLYSGLGPDAVRTWMHNGTALSWSGVRHDAQFREHTVVIGRPKRGPVGRLSGAVEDDAA
jgi:hypothetical protein